MSANLPPSNSAEAAAAIHSVFIEREHPCSPMAAARCGWEAAHRYATAALAAQAAELEALRADAERWRHIDGITGKSSAGTQNGESCAFMVLPAWRVERVGMTLTEAVDAARAALKGPTDTPTWRDGVR